MKKVLFSLLIFLILLLQGCIFYQYKNLSLYQKTFDKGTLKTSGYYIEYYKSPYYKEVQANFVSLYDDGSFLNYGSYDQNGDRFKKLQKKWFYNLVDISSWGCYVIERDSIKIQKFWLSNPGSFIPIWKVCTEVGVVLNDSTFRLDKVVYHDRIHKINETYHFRPCLDCKPDSSKSIINVHLKRLGKRKNYWISPLFTRKVK